jgi:hypothetical protein
MPLLPRWWGKVTDTTDASTDLEEKEAPVERKSRLGILQAESDEVPGLLTAGEVIWCQLLMFAGSVILLSQSHEPLGLRHAHARTSASSLPSPYGHPRRSESRNSRQSSRARAPQTKKTKDGKFILEPQPDDSVNDPLNWPAIRRDLALLSLGFYCMV